MVILTFFFNNSQRVKNKIDRFVHDEMKSYESQYVLYVKNIEI